METRDLTCIGCPLGCQIEVKLDNGTVISVTGILARAEISMPARKLRIRQGL
jgi:CxxC motif-containing protein